MRKLCYLVSFLLVLFACSKDDTTTPEPEVTKEQQEKPKYTISIGAGSGGSVSSAGGIYEEDEEITVTATPIAEYLFESWSDGNTDNPRVIKVTDNLEITANFIKKQYDLTINIVGEGTVTETVVLQGLQYNSGSQIKITAVPAVGWEFDSWSGAVESPENPVIVTMDNPKEVTATFIRKKYDITVNVEGEGEVTEEVIVQPGQYDYETQIKLTAIAAEGWEFVYWDGDIQSSENPIVVSMNSDVEISAVFGSTDIDGDGIPNSIDQDNNTPLGVPVDENGVMLNPIYLDSNGITVKAKDWSQSGFTGELNGSIYTVVDEVTLRSMISNNEDVTKVVTSLITNMNGLFQNQEDFNQDIGSWDVSNVQTMTSMFQEAKTFNQDISSWDVSNVNSMGGMFGAAISFNQNIGSWNTGNVKWMNLMFIHALSFNQDISQWDVSNVEIAVGMFLGATSFNQDLNQWNTSNLIMSALMFSHAIAFNGDISNWDMSNVKYFDGMFRNASSFNGDIGNWNTSSAEKMNGVFQNAVSFNQDISQWDVSNVDNMNQMFSNAYAFNQDISNWDVSNVTNMFSMFQSQRLDGGSDTFGTHTINIGVIDGTMNFNQDLSGWNVTNVVGCSYFSSNTPKWTSPKPNFTNCNPN